MPHQVFISFRGRGQRDNLVSFLKLELERSNINVFIDEDEKRGRPITTLFERIRESSIALVIFSDKFPESSWCLDELVEIKKQMEIGSLVPFPIFYKVKAHSIVTQTGWFGNSLLKTEDSVRKNIDRSSFDSILETEAMIWGWRQALVSVGGIMGLSYRHRSDATFVNDIVVKVKELLDHIIIEKPLMHRQEEITLLLQALSLKKSDLEDLITKPALNGVVSLSLDNLVFLGLNSLKSPILIQRVIDQDQDGKILLVLLGSLEDYNEDFAFKPFLLPKNPQQFMPSSSHGNQGQSYPLPVQVTDVVVNRFQTAESNESLENRPSKDHNFNNSLNFFSLLCNTVKWCAISRRVFISFGEKQIGETLVSFLNTELKSNQISVYVEDETTKEMIKDSRVAIVVFSTKYPESQECLDELVEIKMLMDEGKIDPFPIFYKLKAESVKKIEGWFLNRLLKIEDQVRKNVNRGNYKSILDTEARISRWRQALLSIASRPGLSYQHRSDYVFVSEVVSKVKEQLVQIAIREILKKPNSWMHQQERAVATTTTVRSLDDDFFYSLTSFLQALNLQLSDLECFKEIPNGLVSLRVKGHTNLVFLNLTSFKSQRSGSFDFLIEGFALDLSSVRRLEDPSLFLALESNQPQQRSDNSLIVSSQDHLHHIPSPTP